MPATAALQCVLGILAVRLFAAQLAWFCVPASPHVLAMLVAFLAFHGLLVTDAVSYSLTLRTHAFVASADGGLPRRVLRRLHRVHAADARTAAGGGRACVAAGWLVGAFRTRLQYMQ
jgi:hypothetical protein